MFFGGAAASIALGTAGLASFRDRERSYKKKNRSSSRPPNCSACSAGNVAGFLNILFFDSEYRIYTGI